MDPYVKDAIESAAKGTAEGLSEPITVAIKKLSKYITGISEGRLIERRADADGKALLKRTDALIEAVQRLKSAGILTDELGIRAFIQSAQSAMRQQENLEDIAYKALELLPAKNSNQAIDDDWMAFFVDQSRDVSDEMMQSVWAKILANELASPGRFSRRALATVKLMSVREANAFTDLCSFGWHLDGIVDVIVEREYVFTHEDDLDNLAAIGLITLDTSRLNTRTFGQRQISARYFDKELVLGFPPNVNLIELELTGLTYVGQELFPIAGAKPNREYFEQRIERWKKAGFSITPSPALPAPGTDQEHS